MLGPGSKLGRYELREPIGMGGMSAVYKGYDPVLDREIAIKILSANLACEEIYRKRFEEEARALGRVDHPNLIRIYAVGQAADVSYYAMELVRGMSLHEAVLAKGRFTVEEAMAVYGPFVQGMDACHKADIVHRDIKPGNIMLSESGRVILMDFGLARRTDRKAMTIAGSVLGTPEYMSPEQSRGETADRRSDLYSAGIVLYEMLTGHVPFGGTDTLAILRKHVEAPVPSVRSVVPSVPEVLEKVVTGLLAKKPDQRTASAADLAAEIAPLTPPSRTYQPIVQALVASANQALGKQAPASSDGVGSAASRASESVSAESEAVSAAPTGTRSGSSVSAVQPTGRSSWMAWGAMITAILAVMVALLSLFQPAAAADRVLREIVLADGTKYVGSFENQDWKVLRDDNVDIVFRRRDGATFTLPVGDIERITKWRGRSWMGIGAAVIAFLALIAALVALLLGRRTKETNQDKSLPHYSLQDK